MGPSFGILMRSEPRTVYAVCPILYGNNVDAMKNRFKKRTE